MSDLLIYQMVSQFFQLPENQRLEGLELMVNQLKVHFPIFFSSSPPLHFVLTGLPKNDRIKVVQLLKDTHFWQNMRVESFITWLQVIPQAYWEEFLLQLRVTMSKVRFKQYLEFNLFTEEQVAQIFSTLPEEAIGVDKEISEEEINAFNELYQIWKSTLLSINQLLDDSLLVISYLETLDTKLAEEANVQIYSSKEDDLSEECGFFYPSATTYLATPRVTYHRELDRILLEKEQKNGINVIADERKVNKLHSIPYFFGILSPEEINAFSNRYPFTIFKEIITDEELLLHGNQTHRLQWYLILTGIEQGKIKLPDGMALSDLYNIFFKISFNQKNSWDMLIDRTRYWWQDDLHTPERFYSFLLTAPDVEKKLPYLRAYLRNSLFKKIDRILLQNRSAMFNQQDDLYYDLFMRSSIKRNFGVEITTSCHLRKINIDPENEKNYDLIEDWLGECNQLVLFNNSLYYLSYDNSDNVVVEKVLQMKETRTYYEDMITLINELPEPGKQADPSEMKKITFLTGNPHYSYEHLKESSTTSNKKRTVKDAMSTSLAEVGNIMFKDPKDLEQEDEYKNNRPTNYNWN